MSRAAQTAALVAAVVGSQTPEVMHCWDPNVTIGFAFHAPHVWQAGVGPRQCPGHVRINGNVRRLDRLPTEDVRGAKALPTQDAVVEELPLCRYCDRLPDCATICDTCHAEGQFESFMAGV